MSHNTGKGPNVISAETRRTGRASKRGGFFRPSGSASFFVSCHRRLPSFALQLSWQFSGRSQPPPNARRRQLRYTLPVLLVTPTSRSSTCFFLCCCVTWFVLAIFPERLICTHPPQVATAAWAVRELLSVWRTTGAVALFPLAPVFLSGQSPLRRLRLPRARGEKFLLLSVIRPYRFLGESLVFPHGLHTLERPPSRVISAARRLAGSGCISRYQSPGRGALQSPPGKPGENFEAASGCCPNFCCRGESTTKAGGTLAALVCAE